MLLIPSNLSLYPYQERDAALIVQRKKVFLANEMGTGKTPTAVIGFNSLKARRVLVICPAIMIGTWEAEIEKWSKLKYRIETSKVSAKSLEAATSGRIALIRSYNALTNMRQLSALLKYYPVDCLIFDEWHYCKNPKAKRTKAALNHLCKLPTITSLICLTGTPITRAITDMYTQLLPFLGPELLGGNYRNFCFRYSFPVHNGFGLQFKGSRNTEELKAICKTFMRRRTKAGVLKHLPQKVLSNIRVSIDAKTAKESLSIVDVALREITGETPNSLQADLDRNVDYVATLKRKLGLAKTKPGTEYTKEVLQQKDSLVIFGYHKEVLAVYADVLSKTHSVRVLTGETPQSKRQKYISDFQANKFQVFILNFLAGGVGIDLTRSDHCVLVELDWSPGIMNQAVDRLHRITQKRSVQIDFLIAKQSLDSQIIGTVREKMQTIRSMFSE